MASRGAQMRTNGGRAETDFNHGVAGSLRQVADDVAALAKAEVALAKLELEGKLERIALSAAATAISAMLALIGFAMLCATAVVALEPVWPALWGRMLLMSLCYLSLGGLGTATFSLRLKRRASGNPAPAATREARETLTAVEHEVTHG